MAIDFLLPAARKKSEHRDVLRQTECFARLLARRHLLSTIEQRVSNERAIDSMSAEKRLLEWENDRRLRNQLGKFRNPPRAPGPDLRRDVVKHGHTRLLCRGCHLHVETRVIDQDYQRELATIQHFPDRAEQQEVSGHVLQ